MKTNQERPSLLLVDDSPENLSVLSGFLTDFKCRVALNGETALKIAAAHNKLDLILLDVNMPGIDGYEVIKRLKANKATQDIPVIFLTANTEIEDERRGLELGAVDYITKPFSPMVVLARVNTHLEIKAQREELQNLLKNTLAGTIKVLTEILTMSTPLIFNKVSRQRRYMRDMVEVLKLDNSWQYELAAMLSQIGYITLPANTIDKIIAGEKLTSEEQKILDKCPKIGAELIENIPRLEAVAGMIANQQITCGKLIFKNEQMLGDPKLLGGHLLKLINDFDQNVVEGLSHEMALVKLKSSNNLYNPYLLNVLKSVLNISKPLMIIKTVAIKDLSPGMVFNESVFSSKKRLLASKGTEITVPIIRRIEHFAKLSLINWQYVSVFVQEDD